MTPVDIRIALLCAGIRQIDLAREYGCRPPIVHLTLEGKRNSRPLQRFIARKLQLPVAQVFPRRRAA